MSGNKFLADTNVIIHHLAGNEQIESLFEGSVIYISSITYAELLAGILSVEEEAVLKQYLDIIHIVHTNDFICETAASFRKTIKLKLPDALIASTSIFLGLPLVTFDADFEKINELSIIKLKL